MTREEAIEELERLLRHWDDLENDKRCFWGYDKEAVALALTALRPVSREQVEKMFRGCEVCKGAKYVTGSVSAVAPHDDQHEIETDAEGDFDFCPVCGRPITDEAVDIVMRRLEALKDGRV